MLRVKSRLNALSGSLGLLPYIRPRRIDICGCGLSKTGTHSLAGLFSSYNSKHHPDVELRVTLAIECLNGTLDNARAERVLRDRDRKLWLEMESSTLAGILIGPLLEACPDKKFILTLRDVYSWLDSWINHNINAPPAANSAFARLDYVRLRGDRHPANRFDAPLTDLGFPSLASFFQLWTAHNTLVLESVPAQKLFVLKTDEIIGRIPEIARWANINPDTLRAVQGWLASAIKKHGVLHRLDSSYVRDTAEQYCASLMSKYFPDIFQTRTINTS